MDTFTKAAPTGSFAQSPVGITDANSLPVVYTGDHGMGWASYPDGWSSTYTGGRVGYQPSTVLSVHDGVLDFNLHTDAAGDPVGANPSPLPGGNRQQVYGAWSMREQIVPGAGGLADFYQAPLLWPTSDSDGPSAESDFPEGRLDGATGFHAFAHHSNGAQDVLSAGTLDTAKWHTYSEEWGPGFRSYYVDGRLIGTSTNQVWTGSATSYRSSPPGSATVARGTCTSTGSGSEHDDQETPNRDRSVTAGRGHRLRYRQPFKHAR